MVWGFFEWVRGRPFKPNTSELTLPAVPTDGQLRELALLLLDDARAYKAYQLLGGHRERVRAMLESLLRDDPAFRRMDVETRGWGRPRFSVVLSILLEWGSDYAAEQATALANATDTSLREVAARELARTGRAKFAEVLCRLSRDPDEGVRRALAYGLDDALQYGKPDGADCDAAVPAALYHFMLESLRTQRPAVSRFPSAMVKVDRDRAVRDLADGEMLKIGQRGLSHVLAALREANAVVPLPRLRVLLTDAVAIFDRPGFHVRDHPMHGYTVGEILHHIALRDRDEGARLMTLLRAHPVDEARSAAQRAREQLRPDPFRIAYEALDAVGTFEAMRREHRVVYLVQVFAGEISNGGWEQWVANESGARLRETEGALREVGATAAADAVRTALARLGPDGVSEDRTRRTKAIDQMIGAGRSLPADALIWTMETEIRELLLDYAERHPDAF